MLVLPAKVSSKDEFIVSLYISHEDTIRDLIDKIVRIFSRYPAYAPLFQKDGVMSRIYMVTKEESEYLLR